MVIAEISVVPIGTCTPSVSRYVAKAIGVLGQEKNIKYKLTGMGTILEGELTAVLEAVRKMHDSVFGDQIQRVVFVSLNPVTVTSSTRYLAVSLVGWQQVAAAVTNSYAVSEFSRS